MLYICIQLNKIKMKKLILITTAFLALFAISCKKENNRIRTPNNLFVNVFPHLDTSSIELTNPPINSLYKADFDNYSVFEAQVSGSITERGLIWLDTDASITLDVRNIYNTFTTVVPTITNPYIPTAINLFKGSVSSFPLYFFKYYAKLSNGDIVYSQATSYIHP